MRIHRLANHLASFGIDARLFLEHSSFIATVEAELAEEDHHQIGDVLQFIDLRRNRALIVLTELFLLMVGKSLVGPISLQTFLELIVAFDRMSNLILVHQTQRDLHATVTHGLQILQLHDEIGQLLRWLSCGSLCQPVMVAPSRIERPYLV